MGRNAFTMDPLTTAFSSAPLAEPTFTSSILNATLSKTASSRLAFLPLTLRDWLLLPLRLIYRAEVLVFVTIPSFLVRILRLDKIIMSIIEGGANLIGGLGGGIEGDVADTVAGAMGAAGTEGVAAAAAEVADGSGFSFGEMLHGLRKFSGFVSYMTSKWSLGCFLVVGGLFE